MIKQSKIEIIKRVSCILGLYGLSVSIVVFAVYGAICFLKKIGWPIW